MKKKGSVSDCFAERNDELRKAFFNQGVYSTCDEVISKVVKTPSSRFWVDPERARDVMSRIEKNPDSISGMHPERQRMYLALYERYQELRRQYPADPKIKVVAMAIYSGAPEFFLAPSTARAIIYH
ncbi:MAG: hypothetical protein K2N35_03550 [Muribaculaceae bacterium]|nr:hypothetical protein [Muribaculaceae bacterium]